MEPQVNRAEFIESVSRGGIILGIVGVGIAALHGKKTVEECFNENHCKACWAFAGCTLPEKQMIAVDSVPTSISKKGVTS